MKSIKSNKGYEINKSSFDNESLTVIANKFISDDGKDKLKLILNFGTKTKDVILEWGSPMVIDDLIERGEALDRNLNNSNSGKKIEEEIVRLLSEKDEIRTQEHKTLNGTSVFSPQEFQTQNTNEITGNEQQKKAI